MRLTKDEKQKLFEFLDFATQNNLDILKDFLENTTYYNTYVTIFLKLRMDLKGF